MKTYLITGGAGFIGSNIAVALIEKGESVRILDNFSTGFRENVRLLDGVAEVVEGSITDLDTVKMAATGVDIILHQAALPSVPRSIEHPVTTTEVNILGTLNVLLAGRDAGVSKIVLASSSSTYGNAPETMKHEGLPNRPISPYAVSKVACEHFAKSFADVYGVRTVSLRYFNVFGPRQNPASQYAAVIPKFIVGMLRGERPVIFGDGTQSRDFTFVSNVIEANLLAAHADVGHGEVLNIACQQSVSLNEIVDELNVILVTRIDPIYAPERIGDVKHSLASIDLAGRLIGYAPTVDWRQGLRRVVEWLREQGGRP